MLEATWWGFVGGVALLLGALIGLYATVPRRVIGLIMAFGAGVLISALAFDLTEEALRHGGIGPAAAGLAAGSLVFFGADTLLDRHSAAGARRKLGRLSDSVTSKGSAASDTVTSKAG